MNLLSAITRNHSTNNAIFFCEVSNDDSAKYRRSTILGLSSRVWVYPLQFGHTLLSWFYEDEKWRRHMEVVFVGLLISLTWRKRFVAWFAIINLKLLFLFDSIILVDVSDVTKLLLLISRRQSQDRWSSILGTVIIRNLTDKKKIVRWMIVFPYAHCWRLESERWFYY